MAMTGPPPCGPWCIASTETNTAGSPIAAPVGFAFHEAVDHPPAQILGTRARGQFKTGIANGIVDTVDVERILHHRVADTIAAAGARLVAEQHDLRLGQ